MMGRFWGAGGPESVPILRAGGWGGLGGEGVLPGDGAAAVKLYDGIPDPLRRPWGRRRVTSDSDCMEGGAPVIFPCISSFYILFSTTTTVLYSRNAHFGQ
jgi:hypothetical protein